MSQQSDSDRAQTDELSGITALIIEGFKSLVGHTSITIRPLTILAGANSSGKSSAMQPLLLLKQTLEANYDPGPLLLNGPNVRFTSAEQILSKITGKPTANNFKIGAEVKIDKLQQYDKLPQYGASIISTYERQPQKGIVLAGMESLQKRDGEVVFQGTLTPQMAHEELEKLDDDILSESVSFSDTDNYEWRVFRERCFFYIGAYDLKTQGEAVFLPGFPRFTLRRYFYEDVAIHARRVIHVPGLRGNPERTYKLAGVGLEFPGTFENYVASIIHYWRSTDDRRLQRLGYALETLGLTWGVEAKLLDDTQVELRVGRLKGRGRTKDMVNIADVGFGVSQTLPVLVALLTAEPGQLVYIEQPEIHLHPRAQFAMAQILADAAKRGVRVVAETHSALLLLGVQALVAEGKLAPDLVALHWFQRDEHGATQITSKDLDEDGAFGDWPEDFADVTLEAQNRYLTAVEARHRKNGHG